jgi:hypothetical protein
MKQKILIIFFLITFNSFAQKNNNIDYITFKYNISIVSFSQVEISIFENQTYGKKTYDLEASYYEKIKKKNKKIKINEEDFNKIIEALCKINSSDLVENFSSGCDGTSTELEFGNYFFNSIKFELWSVHKGQINTKLKNFIEAIQQILKVAEIKIEDYN